MTTDQDYCPTTAESGHLIVDTTEIEVVRQVLDELGIVIAKTDDLPAFELALLELEHAAPPGTPVRDVDPVLTEVRARLAGRCGGWTPFLGKNRTMVSQFGAYPQTRGMTSWDPEAFAGETGAFFDGEAGRGVRVGILDTKIYDHPALADRDIETPDHYKFGEPANGVRFTVEEGHGVFAAGLVLRQAPRATLVARHALGPNGKSTAWKVVQKLAEFYDESPRVDVLVLANGCRTSDGQAPMILDRAIERLSAHVMVVAAAGNHGETIGISTDVQITRNSPTWPAALPRVVAVGVASAPVPYSADGPWMLARYSPDLPWVTCTVDPVDPTTQEDLFVSTYLKATDVKLHEAFSPDDFSSGYAKWVGTSCAAAYLGGAIAAKMAEDQLTAQQALEALYLGKTVHKFDWQYR
ncbi:S8 family serine peptidase [Lentzea sp. NPDC051213]|uniref:S8 family serine peptidase n=1 Tax=Lentzea sp. NPDC051213 TaxID=3364126 RepID=UPI0037A6CAD8